MTLAWAFLFLAGFFEICFTVGLKLSGGFTKLIPSIITCCFIFMSFYCVSQAMKFIPIGTAYAIWAGLGSAGTVIAGIIFFGDPLGWIRILSLALIVIGIVGLKIAHT